jgi:hypothetical protein
VSGGKATIKDLIEYEQYIKASWYNEIGLNSNYNMKRERMVASESEMNDDALIPLVDNMIEWRQNAIDEIKEMYGDRYDLENLRVTLNPVWDLDRMYVGMIPEDTPEEEPETETEPETPEEGQEQEPEPVPEQEPEEGQEQEPEPEEEPEPDDVSERLEDIENKIDEIITEVKEDESETN